MSVILLETAIIRAPRASPEEDMSGPHHDPIEDNIETHPVKLAIWIALGAVALVIGIILVTQLAVGLYGASSSKDDPAMSDKSVAKRLGPVATLAVDPNAPAPAPAPAAPAAAAPAPVAAPAPAAAKADAAGAGKATYDAACAVCHNAGVAGAPKAGDKPAWAARAKQGKQALYNSALKGKGAMPPKGGNASLSDDAVKAAVDHLLAAAK
jgi:cytochrome c5